MKIPINKLAFFTWVVILMPLETANGNNPATPAKIAPEPGKSLAEIESFFDELITKEMEKFHIPGISMVFVRDSAILFKKGYGYADVEKKTPVDPDKTVFYVGSVSKLFTATAIMQLAEQDRIRLDKDINRYLKEFQIDDNFPVGVTVENLLSHTGGFEEKNIGMAAMSADEILPLDEFVSSGKRPRVLPPGKYLSYSNYGYSLLGYLVETISGRPFGEYMEQNILSPLEMHRSSFNYREDVFSGLARGYSYRGGVYKPLPPIFLNVGPAGSLMSTATDMSNFMIAHLQGGTYKDKTMLQPATTSLMHSRLFSQHPRLAGWCHGFYEEFIGGERILEHAGDIYGFASLLALVPDRKVGFFLTCNGGEGMVIGFREKVLERFIEHFYPGKSQPEEIQVTELADDNISRYAGIYRMNRYARLSLEKFLGVIFEGRIIAEKDGSLTLRLPGFMDEPPSSWVMVEPLLFMNNETGQYMAFYEDEDGRITHVNMHEGLPANFEKIPFYATGRALIALVLFFFAVYLSVTPGWLFAKWIRKLRKKEPGRGIPDRKTRQFAIMVSALNLLFLMGFIALLAVLGQKLAVGIPWILTAVLAIPIFSLICLLILLYLGIRTRLNRNWKISGRIQYIVLVATSIVFFWFLNYWNLLGFKY
jgi:CubicO group peptidase (beta-lactamase class C family)